MKHSITIKFLAFLLCISSLVAIIFSGIGIAFMEGYDLYHTDLTLVQQKEYSGIANTLAQHHSQEYALQTLSNAPHELLDQIYGATYLNQRYGQYIVQIYKDGQLVHTEGVAETEIHTEYTLALRPTYPVVTGKYYLGDNGTVTSDPDGLSVASDTPMDEALYRVTGQQPLYSEEFHTDYRYSDELGYGFETVYTINYYEAPEYEVRVKLTKDVLMSADFMLISVLYPYRDYFIPVLLGALVALIVSLVFLFTVAGRNRKGEIHLASINRIPLDLYLMCCILCCGLLLAPVIWLFESAIYVSGDSIWDNPQLCLLICGLCGFGISSLIVGFLYAFAAQSKAPDNYWLRHTCLGWCCRMVGKLLHWVGSGISYVFRGCRAVVRMLPIIWQWLLTAFGLFCFIFLCLFISLEAHGYAQLFCIFMFFFSVIGAFSVVCYGAWCYGVLLKGARKMAQGDLNYQIDTRYLLGCFRDFAQQLNALAGVAQTAAERQMKSERMKAELITNVSHDIKTPLTSIINYVDLLKKPHSEEDGQQYLEVLDRQSQRLKKLIGDLMDMSKASSGNVAVEIDQVDAVEAVNQALGEFADKLEKVNLTPIFRHPEEPVLMQADGKLVWRVLSNLLSNAVKYALPDTRLYVDLMVLEDSAVLAIKNISRDQLNVNADELMERFVRGDASRNTEGSGLGLNIAKNLVELQNGQMHLMVDGDLFKVTLIFPLI